MNKEFPLHKGFPLWLIYPIFTLASIVSVFNCKLKLKRFRGEPPPYHPHPRIKKHRDLPGVFSTSCCRNRLSPRMVGASPKPQVIHNMLNSVENYLDDDVFWWYSYPQQSKKPIGYQPTGFSKIGRLRDELPTRSRRNLEPSAQVRSASRNPRSLASIVLYRREIVKDN